MNKTVTAYLDELKSDPERGNSKRGKISITILESGIFNDSWELIGSSKTPAGSIRALGKSYKINDPKALLGDLISDFQQWFSLQDGDGRKKETEENFNDLLFRYDACAHAARRYAKGIQEKTLTKLRTELEDLKRKTMAGELLFIKDSALIVKIIDTLKRAAMPGTPKDVIYHRTSELMAAFGVSVRPGTVAKTKQRDEAKEKKSNLTPPS